MTTDPMQGYKKLIAWQKADILAHEVYSVTQSFPKSEMFGLTSQLRRAALAVPAKIVEGHARVNRNEFHHFLSIALGSLSEVAYFLDFSYKQQLIEKQKYDTVFSLREECGKLLWALYLSQKKVINNKL